MRGLPTFGDERCRPVDTLIVGASPAGLAAARFLSDEGRSATVLEKRPILGGNSPWRDRAGTSEDRVPRRASVEHYGGTPAREPTDFDRKLLRVRLELVDQLVSVGTKSAFSSPHRTTSSATTGR